MSFDPIGFMFPKSNIPKGGYGYTDSTGTVHMIDPKYLPGAVLPVVELKTTATAEGVALKEEDVAKLKAIGFALPCVVKCTLASSGFPMSFVAQGFFVDYGDGDILYIATGKMDLGNDGKYGFTIGIVDGVFTIFDVSEFP